MGASELKMPTKDPDNFEDDKERFSQLANEHLRKATATVIEFIDKIS